MKSQNNTCVSRLKTIPAWQSSKSSGRWLGRWYTGMGRWGLASRCPRRGAGGTPPRSPGSFRGRCWRWAGFLISIVTGESPATASGPAHGLPPRLRGALVRGRAATEARWHSVRDKELQLFHDQLIEKVGERKELDTMRPPDRLRQLWRFRTGYYRAQHRSRRLPAVLCGFLARQCPRRSSPGSGRHRGWWTVGGQ